MHRTTAVQRPTKQFANAYLLLFPLPDDLHDRVDGRAWATLWLRDEKQKRINPNLPAFMAENEAGRENLQWPGRSHMIRGVIGQPGIASIVMRHLALLSLLLVLPAGAGAAENFCDTGSPHPIDEEFDHRVAQSGGVTVHIRNAQAEAYERWDAELNRIYRELTDLLPRPTVSC